MIAGTWKRLRIASLRWYIYIYYACICHNRFGVGHRSLNWESPSSTPFSSPHAQRARRDSIFDRPEVYNLVTCIRLRRNHEKFSRSREHYSSSKCASIITSTAAAIGLFVSNTGVEQFHSLGGRMRTTTIPFGYTVAPEDVLLGTARAEGETCPSLKYFLV